MASREKNLTEKGEEYQLKVKFESLREAWRSIKAVSEELRLFMAENCSVREAKVLYAKWMNLYEAFMGANDNYCFLVSEDVRKDHFDNWFKEKDVFISNAKSSVEDWLLGKTDEHSAVSKQSKFQSKKSSVRLAEGSKKLKELKKMEDLLKEKQAMEFKVKMLEMELQHERERKKVCEEIAKSQGRTQLIQEMEENDEAHSQKLLVEEESNNTDSKELSEEEEEDDDYHESVLSTQADNSEIMSDDVKRPAAVNVACESKLGEVLLELQKPKLEIKRFDGDCLSFNNFKRQFKSRVENNCNADEKMAFLEQCTTGEASQIVAGYSFLTADVGYPAAWKELSRRYGDVEVMANAYLKRVLNWQPIRHDDPKALDEFSVFLKECKTATQCAGGLGVLEYRDNLQQILRKLPPYMHDRWRRIVQERHHSGQSVKFTNLVDFVEIEAMQMNDPVWGKEALLVGQKKDKGRPKIAAASNASEAIKCWGCDGSHKIAECSKMKNSSLTERKMLIRARKLCFNCLKKGHISTKFPSKMTCALCKKKHHILLHEFAKDVEQQKNIHEINEGPQQAGASNAVNHGCCTLPIIPVKVSLASRVVECNAFLDPGSNVSFITERLAGQLQGTGIKTMLNLKKMGNQVCQQTTMISGLKIVAVNGEGKGVDLPPVFTKPSLPVDAWQIPTRKDIAAWEHLKTIKLPKSKINTTINILIGNSVPAAFAPIEVKTGSIGSPFATKTLLGWVVWGMTRKGKQ